jgi:hypothetical protein
MEWLTNLLGFSNQGTSPFGSLSGSSAMTPPGGGGGGYNGPAGNIGFGQGVGATGPIPAAAMPPAGGGAPGGMQMPGLLGKLLGQQPQAGAAGATGGAGGALGLGGASGGSSGALLGQALGLLKGQQIQAPPMMNLLSGPRG